MRVTFGLKDSDPVTRQVPASGSANVGGGGGGGSVGPLAPAVMVAPKKAAATSRATRRVLPKNPRLNTPAAMSHLHPLSTAVRRSEGRRRPQATAHLTGSPTHSGSA